jgi:N-acetylglucosamine-6-phosphate deacetylase
MSRFRFVNGNIVTAETVLQEAEIHVEGNQISVIGPLTGAEDRIDLGGGWLLPGFIDAQVNGGGGALFNDRPDVDGIATIGAAHARFGTTGFLPTLISGTPEQIALGLDAVDDPNEARIPGGVGIHIL